MSQGFLEPFNAKAMSFADVARTFVPSTKFALLAGPWNSVLVGPRGGGKTTLLKMLSAEGQAAWNGPQADEVKSTLGYTGVYVPSDIAWGTMLESLQRSGQNERVGILFSQAAFVTHVLLAVASGIERHVLLNPVRRSSDVVDDDLRPTQAALEAAIKSIAMLWRLKPISLSPASLVEALRLRLLDIKSQAHLCASLGPEVVGEAVFRNCDYLGLDMLEATSQGLQTFDAMYGRPDHRWCLLLDEFEVAPMHLQQTVLASMRASGGQKLLLKVALAPCGPDLLYQRDVAAPSQLNDVRQVELWYADKAEASEFCKNVFLSRSQSYVGLSGETPNNVFGTSAYSVVDEGEEAEQLGLFARATRAATKQITDHFVSLSEKDASFVRFLERKNIDLTQELGMQPSDLNGNTLRKVAPLVAFRNAYRGRTEGRKRGVKPFNATYAGWESLSAISEGNPRWLIGLITRILSHADLKQLPVPVPRQTEGVLWNCQRYSEMLQSLACEQFHSIKTSSSVFQVLEKIGDYFHDRLVTADFVEDPPLSFIVDNDVDDDVENALRIAMNHGAIVCFESPSTVGGYQSLRGKRFRLTYLLAPIFKLPMRKSKSVSLSAILNPPAVERKIEAKVDEPPLEQSGAWMQDGLF